MRRLLAICLAGTVTLAAMGEAAARTVPLPTRPGVRVVVFDQDSPGAEATVVLLPGGAGGIGKIINDRPTGANFLIRSIDLFVKAGFNVVAMGKPSDRDELDGPARTSREHLDDLRAVVDHARAEFGKPVWLVGTSMGTISATAAAVDQGNRLAGIVLTSSVTNTKPGAVPSQDLAAIAVPVLVVHHRQDECKVCRPDEAAAIVDGLRNAPVRKLVLTEGGGPVEGPPCEPLHWHGFIGAEGDTVARIAAWMRAPGN